MGTKSKLVISKCKESENWTKVSFKPNLAKFNMTHLEDDVVALMKKRLFDLAGCLGKSVKVELNGTRVPVKSFTDYVNFYLDSAAKSKPEKPSRLWWMLENLLSVKWKDLRSAKRRLRQKHFLKKDWVNNLKLLLLVVGKFLREHQSRCFNRYV